jgi:hypothetical protein
MINLIGWISLHRSIMDTREWLAYEFTPPQAWIDLLMLARHEDGIVMLKGIEVPLKRGQVGWSQQALSKRWKWSRGKVRRFLERKENDQKVVQHGVRPNRHVNGQANKYITTVISITNYDQYQDTEQAKRQVKRQANGQATDRPRTGDGTGSNNGNNEKNEKEVKDMCDFNEFWSAFPSRNGKKLEKTATIARYNLQPLKDREAILTAVHNYSASDLVKKGIGIKDPKRFLVNWKDWQEAEKVTGQGKSYEDNLAIINAIKLKKGIST